MDQGENEYFNDWLRTDKDQVHINGCAFVKEDVREREKDTVGLFRREWLRMEGNKRKFIVFGFLPTVST